jgi:hypothetical protein
MAAAGAAAAVGAAVAAGAAEAELVVAAGNTVAMSAAAPAFVGQQPLQAYTKQQQHMAEKHGIG